MLALNRPNALVFAVAAAAVVVRRAQWRDGRVKRGAVLVTALLAVLAANAARNYAVSGDVVLIASHGGLNLYIGNHDRADGTYTPVPGITPSIAGQAGDSTRVAESSTGRRLSPGEVSSYFAWRAFDWVTGHPADALRLWIRKIGILLNRVDVPLNYSYAFYAREPFSFLRVLAVGPWLLLPLGLVGLFWPALRTNRDGYWVWAMFVPVYGAAVVLFFVTDRYRMPLFVPLCAAAGAALVRCFDLVRARQFSALLRPAGAIAMASLVVFSNLGLDNGIGGEQTRQAVWLVEQGSFDEARRYVEQISHDHSHPGVLRFSVAQALLDAGRPDEAAALLFEAIAIDGPRPAIRLALGEALLRAGRAGEAVKQLSGIEDSVAGTSVESALDFGTLALEQQRLARSDPLAADRGSAGAGSGRGAREAGRGDFPERRSSHRSSLSRARLPPRPGERQRPPQSGRGLRRTRQVCRGQEARRSKRFGSIPPRRAPRPSSKPCRSRPSVRHASGHSQRHLAPESQYHPQSRTDLVSSIASPTRRRQLCSVGREESP